MTTKSVTLAELADQNVLTALDNKVGIGTSDPQSTLQVGIAITMDGNAGVITAQSYYGDGSNLTGIDLQQSSLSDTDDTIRVQANTSGAVVTGILTATGFNATGVATATRFEGNLTGDVTGNIDGIVGGTTPAAVTGTTITANTGFVGNVTGNATGLSGSPNITVTDITATNITATGTLTYEDVTNVDSLGIATARTGLNVVGGGLTVTGVSTFFNAAGIVGGGLTVTGISTFYTDYVNIGEVAIGASISAVGQAKFAGVVTSLGADTGILTARTDIHAGYYYESSDPGIGVTINSTTGITLDAGSNACQVINPLLINYAEKVNNIGNTGANRTIDIADGTYVTATLDQACTFAFTSPPSGKLYGFALQLTNGSGGAYSISWPGTVKWPGGSVPVRTTTDAKTDIWSFFTSDGGTNWFGAISLYNYS